MIYSFLLQYNLGALVFVVVFLVVVWLIGFGFFSP